MPCQWPARRSLISGTLEVTELEAGRVRRSRICQIAAASLPHHADGRSGAAGRGQRLERMGVDLGEIVG